MNLQQRLNELSPIGIVICNALRKQVLELGFPANFINPNIDRAEYRLSTDPASGKDTLIGIWRDAGGQKQGEILFHADGSFFAEYDVISEHPKKAKWFVESVTAWGRDQLVKAEPKLLPMAE